LTSAILLEAGLDPSFMIGGCINNRVSPMCLGQGEYFVVEADESDASFLSLSPEIAIVNNIEVDHIETYNGDFNQLKDTFVKFLHRLPSHGLAILGTDDLAVADLMPHLNCPFLTFGFSESADVRATEFKQQGLKSSFVVLRPGCEPFEVNLNLPGKHNALNALAAITVALHLNIDDQAVLQALANFSGVGRRFHARGELAVKGGTALVIDDYGHHPGAIVATLDAARLAWPERRIVLAFQPHRYSRTQDLMNEFAVALSKADLLICLEIYSAGESPISGVNGQALCHTVEQLGIVKPIFVAEIDQLPARLQEILHPNDILLMQGAGDISLMAIQLGNSSNG
jgi:UDP-N-acetylmuramate--alanine ligase